MKEQQRSFSIFEKDGENLAAYGEAFTQRLAWI
jgi:hypothetical protein